MNRPWRWLSGSLLGVLVVSGCYLPGNSTERSVESQVLVSVYRCQPEFVAGEISNRSSVPVAVTVTARWLDNHSEALHEVMMEAIPVGSGETVEWQADAEVAVENPQICEGETVAVVEAD